MTSIAPSLLQPAIKRKASAAGLSDRGNILPRRASKACHGCRSRKVRCDVVGIGMPCTNCSIYGVECLVTEGGKRKKSFAEANFLNSSLVNSIEGVNEFYCSSMINDIEGLRNLFTAGQNRADELKNLIIGENALTSHMSHTLNMTEVDRFSLQERARRLSVIGQPRMAIPPAMPPCTPSPCSPRTLGQPEIVLPHYITTMPLRMASEDIIFLRKKGAFLVPDTDFRNELLRSYVQFVHPYLPLLDLEAFLMAIEKNDRSSTIGLILYQAVMFAGTAYIEMRFLTAQGYHSRKEAGQAFFRRVKLLYDFDYEADRITVVQAVLLMTLWWENTDNPKDIWQLLGVAISLARTVGLDRDTSRSPLTAQRQRLWKRIWWSCYIRDRLVAMAMRRPSRIRDDDFNVAILELDDFETNPLPTELMRMLGGYSVAADASKRQTLAKMCIAMAKCCRCIAPILVCQYSVLTQSAEVIQEMTSRLVPEGSLADPYEIFRCDRELEFWYHSLSEKHRWFTTDSREQVGSYDGDVIELHRALLTGIYLAASCVLHTPQMMPSAPNVKNVPELQKLSARRAREAAGRTTDIYRTLHAHNLLCYLPDTGVTILLPAIIIHLMEIKSCGPEARQLSAQRFHFCMKALKRLSDMYAYADRAISFVDVAMRKPDTLVIEATSMTLGKPGTDNQYQSSYASTEAEAYMPQLSPPAEEYQIANTYIQATKVAKILVSNCTLTQQERSLFAGLTPPTSNFGSTYSGSVRSASAASTPIDLGHVELINRESIWAEQTEDPAMD